MKQITVSKNEAGQRLDKLLAKYLNKAPKSFIYKCSAKKNITLNGKRQWGMRLPALGMSQAVSLRGYIWKVFRSAGPAGES